MESRFLLDTNICIYIRRKKPEVVLRRFRTLKAGEAALSVITFGNWSTRRKRARSARRRWSYCGSWHECFLSWDYRRPQPRLMEPSERSSSAKGK